MSPKEDNRGYQSIAEDLRDLIRNGHYVPGELLPTERELQTRFNVSRSTVRRALSALTESGWAEAKPNRGVAARRGPEPERSRNIAFIDHAESVNQGVFFAIGRELQTHGMHLIHIDSRTRGMEGALEYAADQGMAAAFVWSKTGFPDAERVAAVQRRMPIVAVDHGLRGVNCDLIVGDNFGGARAVVGLLAAAGRQRIAVSGMMDMLEINHERFSGYLQGIFQSNLVPSAANFLFCVTSGGGEPDTRLLAHRLREPDRPDAIFVMQDMFVPAVVETIFAAGLRIPEDVAIASFGWDLPIQIDEVGLTTAFIDWGSFATTCVSVLTERLSSPSEPFRQSVLPMHVVVRGSCGSPPSHWTPDLVPHEGLGPSSLNVWRLQNEYLQIRSSSSGRQPALTP